MTVPTYQETGVVHTINGFDIVEVEPVTITHTVSIHFTHGAEVSVHTSSLADAVAHYKNKVHPNPAVMDRIVVIDRKNQREIDVWNKDMTDLQADAQFLFLF